MIPLLCYVGNFMYVHVWRIVISACSVAASYKPPMLVTQARLPACAEKETQWDSVDSLEMQDCEMSVLRIRQLLKAGKCKSIKLET